MRLEECPKCCGTGIDELAVSCEDEPPVSCDLCDGCGEVDPEEADFYYADACMDNPRDFDPFDVEIDSER